LIRKEGIKVNINKIEDLVSLSKLGDLIHKGEVVEQKEKKCNCVVVILAIIGAVAAIAAIAYGVYRYFTPDYLEDFEDDFDDDDFEDDFDDEAPAEKKTDKED
jgi:hypothetical protein